MKLRFLQQWPEDYLKFVYQQVKAGAEAKLGGAGEKSEAPLEFDESKKTEDDQWQAIDQKYGKSAYQSLIIDAVDKLLPGSQADYRMALVTDSTKRYMKTYQEIKLKFMKEKEELKDKFDDAVESIEDKTKSELATLKSAVEASRPLIDFKEAMPAIENESGVTDHFEQYLDALNGRYFNEGVNEGIEIPAAGIKYRNVTIHDKDVLRGSAYKSKSSEFQGNMKNRVQAKVTWLLKQKGTTAGSLEDFKKEIAARYEEYAKIDGNSGIISGADLAAMEKSMHAPDAIGQLLDESDSEAAKRCEIMILLNPDEWELAIKMAGERVIREAKNGNFEEEFIAEVRKRRGEEIKDFDEAVSEFEDMLEEISKVGAPETIEFLRSFNTGVLDETQRYRKEVNPPALTMQVSKQLDYLLGGILVPEKETDRTLVQFMKSDRDERNEMLANDATRDVLFRAIRQATEQYPELFDQKYGSIEDDVSKLKRRRNIANPTSDDKAAQLQALIILGNQARVIVGKLNKDPQNQNQKFDEEIKGKPVPEESSAVLLGGFKPSGQKNAPYLSALHRGGFNSLDLALKGGKLLGCLVILSNIAQSYSETSGDFVDRIMDTVEKSVTNQGVLIGAAVTVGSHLAERDKRFLKYPWLSPHERASAVIGFKLDNISARVGRKEMEDFIFNNSEWRALADPAMDASQIKELLTRSAERAKSGQKPEITVDDLREVIKDEGILTTLTMSGRSPRMRYLFYEKFFSSAVKPDVNHTKELVNGSNYIAPSPVEES